LILEELILSIPRCRKFFEKSQQINIFLSGESGTETKIWELGAVLKFYRS